MRNYSKIITFRDTGETVTYEFESIEEILFSNADNILGANAVEGREETTYWRDPIKKEEYRLYCLEQVKNA
jgi:hypothetical protein